jgi:hypothetical protein
MPEVYSAAAVFLAETLDWLNLWHSDSFSEPDGDQSAPPNHLPPRP